MINPLFTVGSADVLAIGIQRIRRGRKRAVGCQKPGHQRFGVKTQSRMIKMSILKRQVIYISM